MFHLPGHLGLAAVPGTPGRPPQRWPEAAGSGPAAATRGCVTQGKPLCFSVLPCLHLPDGKW